MLRPLSDQEKAANWAVAARWGRRWFIVLLLPLLGLLWASGYAKGLLDGWAEGMAARQSEIISKESK